MFRFGFGDDAAETERDHGAGDGNRSASAKGGTTDSANVSATKETTIVQIPRPDVSSLTEVDVAVMANGQVQMRKATASGVPTAIGSDKTDLVHGVYEGGFKLWEGACDLVSHIHSTCGSDMRGATVLELGAGHALPAIYTATKGARAVAICDFNEEVLREVSSVNFELNVEGSDVDVQYIAGDWSGIPTVLLGRKFDFVLAAEVTYSPTTLRALSMCIIKCVHERGVALVAGKTYYFGVGGGTELFISELKSAAASEGCALEINRVNQIRDGKSNVREVVEIRMATRSRPE